MQEVIMAKYGEIALKGLNKNTFEDLLVRNIKRRIKRCGEFHITRNQSTIYISPENDDAAKAYSGRKLKSLDYSSNTGSERYLIAFKESGVPEETLIYFEPDEDLINILKAAAPNMVHVK